MTHHLPHPPHIVGITGGIGSGKSTVCRTIAAKGHPVYNSDLSARHIIDTDPAIRRQLSQLFDNDIYLPEGLDRKRVASIVFTHPDLLQQMNAIVHPAVKNDFLHWAQAHDTFPFLFLEAAILIESGFDRLCNTIVVITAPEEVRIRRVTLRDRIDEQSVLRRIANQKPENELLASAHIVLNNDGQTPVDTLVDRLLTQLATRTEVKPK